MVLGLEPQKLGSLYATEGAAYCTKPFPRLMESSVYCMSMHRIPAECLEADVSEPMPTAVPIH